MASIPDFSAVIADRMLGGNASVNSLLAICRGGNYLKNILRPWHRSQIIWRGIPKRQSAVHHLAGDVDFYPSTHVVAAAFINA